MNISQIDKDFINIIDYLDKKGFKPYSSCDGVLANHTDTKSVTSAYIGFLKSQNIIDLMAAFLRDKDSFEVMLSSEDHVRPYYYFDNLIQGNRYMVQFSNKKGELTTYFEKIIMSLVEGKISISEQEKNDLTNLSNVLEENEDSDLSFSLSLNSEYQPYMNKEGRVNVLRVSTKEGAGYSRNMHSLVDILKEKFGIVKKTDSMEETFEDSEFAVSSFDGSTSEIYLSDEHVKDVCKLIESIRDIGPSLPTFEVRDCDFMDIDYSDEEQNI